MLQNIEAKHPSEQSRPLKQRRSKVIADMTLFPMNECIKIDAKFFNNELGNLC